MSTCGLCKQDRELVSSHLIPASAYRKLRDEGRQNPNPIVFTESYARSTSNQVQKAFLCSSCEQRLSESGERLVMSECAQEDRFPLRERLKTIPPLTAEETVAAFDLKAIFGESAANFLYFPVSVFWRASATLWKDRGELLRLSKFGPYQEHFRQFLLGEAEFPKRAAMVMQVAIDEPNKSVSFPTSDVKRGYTMHQFYIPGIMYTLFVGRMIPPSYRALEMLQRDAVVTLAGPLSNAGVFRHLARRVRALPASHKLRTRSHALTGRGHR